MNTHIVWAIISLGWFVTVPLAAPLVRAAGIRGVVAAGWLPAALVWALCAALEWRPIGFSSSIVLLTAAHFTHAGFGVSVLLLAVDARRAFWVHQAAMVVVAAGLTAELAEPGSAWGRLAILQPIGAHIVVGVLVVYATRAWRRRDSLDGWRRALLTASAIVWCYPMLIAVSWAFDRLDLLAPLVRGIDAVVAQHGAVNAIGLVLCGVIALRPAVADSPVPPLAATTQAPLHDVKGAGHALAR